MSSASFVKRLEQLEKAIRLKQPRQITILIDGYTEDHSAADAILHELTPGPDDLVIFLARYGSDDAALPRLLAVTDL